MKKKTLGLKGKIGICVLLATFIILPISPNITFASESKAAAPGGAAAAGAAGAGGTAGLSNMAIVGIAAAAVLIAAAVASAISDDAPVPAPHHH